MIRLIPCILIGLFMSAPALAQAPELPVDSRIKIFTYSPADVYRVPTKYGYQTSIVFARNEEISTVSVGDRSMWQIIPNGNRLFLRPMNDGLSTNMTVITNVREYNFDIVSVEEDDKNNLYVIQFRYPDSQTSLRDTIEDVEMPAPPVMLKRSENGVTIPNMDTQRTQAKNLRYTYTGPDALAPAYVYDDGKRTYVVYGALPSPAPVPLIESGGTPVVAAHRLDGNTMVLATVASGFVLESPGGRITVYNELYQTN